MPPGLGSTLGAVEIGGVFSTLFFGILTMQVYNYYRDYLNDRGLLKAMVMGIWSIELVHTMLLWHTIYSLTVTFFGHPEQIFTPPETFYFTILCSSLITTAVQIFFANRIRVFSGRKLVPAISCIMSCLYFGGMLAALILLCVHRTLAVLETYRWLASTIFALTAVIDMLIAISMCYWLGRVRNSDFPKTRNIIDTLIMWCIESTVAKSGASVVQLILFLTRNDFLWLIFLLPKASLFSNSMLAALNGRNRIRSAGEDPASGHGPTFITFNSAADPTQSPRSRNVIIQMTRMTETHIDDGMDECVTESKTDRNSGVVSNSLTV
ncbi:hypothetical protein DFH08DRAFT_388800 [Mycena albidolilacea]|uniref:DUF6534 domain-containing protein n=1 Tax=Mycena albidolilacea TaxID=1033008 RepID=A0AAD6ZFC0_9AGAR|nr:hypothetical protein DFH08DRAFT_388800 [Mycena albidolilacea]